MLFISFSEEFSAATCHEQLTSVVKTSGHIQSLKQCDHSAAAALNARAPAPPLMHISKGHKSESIAPYVLARQRLRLSSPGAVLRMPSRKHPS